MRPLAVALALLASLASGCSSAFVCSRHGGMPWRELGTEHFVLRTDHEPEVARALALQLEQLRDAVASTLLEGTQASGPRIQVVMPRWRARWDELSPAGSGGLFTLSRWWEPTIVLPPGLGAAQRGVIAHEVVHALSAVDVSRQPPWYREGLATYAETVQFVGDDGSVMLGDSLPALRRLSLPPIRGSLRGVLTERGGLRAGGYLLAWALVHFLLTEHPDRLGALEDRFARGEDPSGAWSAVFPEWALDAPGGVDRLEAALSEYAARPVKAHVFTHRRLASIPPPTERMLPAAEVHDLRLSLPRPNQGHGVPHEDVLAEAREALAEDPGMPTAVAILLGEGGADAGGLAVRATKARPEDPRNWVLLGNTFPAGDVAGREKAFRRAVAAGPDDATALSSLARFLLGQGRTRDALAPARRAVELAPWNVGALEVAAAVLVELGNCPGAIALEDRAVDVVRHLSDRISKPIVQRRDRLRRCCEGCGLASPASGPEAGSPR